jgi:hypothetical protein
MSSGQIKNVCNSARGKKTSYDEEFEWFICYVQSTDSSYPSGEFALTNIWQECSNYNHYWEQWYSGIYEKYGCISFHPSYKGCPDEGKKRKRGRKGIKPPDCD